MPRSTEDIHLSTNIYHLSHVFLSAQIRIIKSDHTDELSMLDLL